MKKSLILAFIPVFLFLFTSPLYPQERVGEFRIIQEWGYNNVGAKAWGMGGAFVAQADDISAFFWNPAGLTQLEGTKIYTDSSFAG